MEVFKLNKLKVVVLDTGSNSINFKNNIKKINLINNDMKDNIGHGTAVSSLIDMRVNNISIFSVKIFDVNHQTTEEDITNALKWVDKYINPDVINISSGTNYIFSNHLKDTVDKLIDKGVIIVAAADNKGILSYPASFENVIGVQWSEKVINPQDFIFVKNSPINILGYGGRLLVPWIDNKKNYVSGSSFITPLITAEVIKLLQQNNLSNLDEINHKLESLSIKSIKFKKEYINSHLSTLKENIKNIKKAIIFPVNKETKALLGNKDLLDFEIVGVFDTRLSKNIGKRAEKVVFGKSIVNNNIQSIDEIDWNSEFDTVILGHVENVSKQYKFDFLEKFLKLSKEHNKSLYSFDEGFSNKNENNSLYLSNENIQINSFGNLNKIPIPVIGVIGTSSKQGKYNLQLSLRRNFQQDGYRVGQVGTEPNSLLFGIDIIDSNGYNSQNNLTAEKEIFYLNNSIFNLTDKDVVIVGTQSQTIPLTFGNLGFYPLTTNNVLLATQPDIYILCINYQDSISYIKRNIDFIKSYYNRTIIALCVFPKIKEKQWNVAIENINLNDMNELKVYIDKVYQTFNIPTYINNKDNLDIYHLTKKKFMNGD